MRNSMIPSSTEMSRRFSEGITIRQAELWAAQELSHAANLLKKEDEIPATKEQMIHCIEFIKKQLDTIVQCVK